MSHYTNENGRLIVIQEDGTEVPVFAKVSGGVLHCMIRCVDEATFEAVGLETGLLSYENPGSPAVIDPETGDEITPEVPPSGDVIPTHGNTVNRMGRHVITPPVLDEDGTEVTPGVYDDRYHVNFWVDANGDWEGWIVEWMVNGVTPLANSTEDGSTLHGVELLDPLSITTPTNVLL